MEKVDQLKTRWKEMLAQYGGVALTTYLTIFALVLFGFALAIQVGFQVEGTAGSTGLWVGAYLATKLTQPIRIGVTLVLTPFIARAWWNIRGRQPTPETDDGAVAGDRIVETTEDTPVPLDPPTS
ncbi:MAG: hypothetical protein QGG40_02285 [Myxococcota bacterium]|jgi:hypothetical protein|nr:hypothetical protein [Myxococcota bacterium]